MGCVNVGFYKQNKSLIHVTEVKDGKVFVTDQMNLDYFIWDSIPDDCEFLSKLYEDRLVQEFVRSNGQS